jgi:hypothetical protein
MSRSCESAYPSLSEPLLRLMLGSLEDRQRLRSRFYNTFLVRRFPAYFANIPWQKSGRGLSESLATRVMRSFRSGAAGLCRAFFRPVMGRGLGNVLPVPVTKVVRSQAATWTRNSTNPFSGYFVDEPSLLRDWKATEKLLQSDLLVDEFLGGLAKRVLADSDHPVPMYSLSGILTIETYLRQVAGRPCQLP